MKNTRKEKILSIVPKDVINVLDIGSSNNLFNGYDTICLDLNNVDIIQDLNKNQKIPLKSKSIDLVVLSQILEHLVNVEEIISESFRISRKYILVGLPNEVKLDNRIKFLFGKPINQWKEGKGAYYPYGHKHIFSVPLIEEFVMNFFHSYKSKYFIYGVSGGRYIPTIIKKILTKILPNLFAGEVYYLIDIRKPKNRD